MKRGEEKGQMTERWVILTLVSFRIHRSKITKRSLKIIEKQQNGESQCWDFEHKWCHNRKL